MLNDKDKANLVKNKLKNYFDNLTSLILLKDKLEFLEIKRIEIENDLKNDNINLNSCISSINYDNVSVKNKGFHCSEQENSIEKAYNELEKNLIKVTNKIYDIKVRIREIEFDSSNIDFILNMLDEHERNLIYLKYKKKKSCYSISFSENMSASNISRKLNKIYIKIYDLLFDNI